MTPLRIVAVLLVTAGLAALIYGGFSYTTRSQQARLGPIELTVDDTRRVNVPVWAGLAAVAAGVGLACVRR